MGGPGSYLSGEEERKHVLEVIESGYLSRYGTTENMAFKQKVHTFERRFAEHVGAKHALAVNSGTSAIMASLVAIGVRPGDEVLVPGYTFIASMSAVIAVGARPVLVEINDSLTMDPDDFRAKIGPRTKAVIPVHMLGNPCDMERINGVARKHNVKVLEDACQAVGGSFKGRCLGTWGHMGAFSFNIYKVINAGDAGLLVTDHTNYFERAFAFHDQGHRPFRQGVEVGNRNVIGINLRMNELTGAFLLGQLEKIDFILRTLREKKARLKEAIIEGLGAQADRLSFRKINDPGECATLLTMIFPTRDEALRVAGELSTKTLDQSGWHVYNNMEHLVAYRDPDGSPVIRRNELPKTDDILSRSVNLSVGVVDTGIGAGVGINIRSTEDEISAMARRVVGALRRAFTSAPMK